MGFFDWLHAPGARRKALEELEKRLEILEKNQRGGVTDSGDAEENMRRLDALEQGRTELLCRIDELNKALAHANEGRLDVLEQNRTELFRRIGEMSKGIDQRFAVLEENRTDLYARVDEIRDRQRGCGLQGVNQRLAVLEENRTNLYARMDEIRNRLRACGLLNLNARFDSRIIRLEMLSYYAQEQNAKRLSPVQRRMLNELRDHYDYERNGGRTYPEDPFFAPVDKEALPYPVKEEDGLWYAQIDGKKVFLGENEQDARAYLRETVYWLEGDTPHRYLNPDEDGVDVPEDAILLDIGAAEGYFGMKYLSRCKKVYFFEYDERWLRLLRKTCEPVRDKVEIVKAYVGDGEGQLRLDDFFRTREKPTFVKMDIEGSEGGALRGMKELLEDDALPMTLLICTYHHQEDWERFSAMLGERFELHASERYYWDMQDPYPPFFRHGVMRAVKKRHKGGKNNAIQTNGGEME